MAVNEISYSEKLKDPRWQKLRLQVFDRDDWCCQICDDSENTLNAHHIVYIPNKEPWEYNLFDLLTLCEDCHEAEKLKMQDIEHDILLVLKRKFLHSDNLHELCEGFVLMELPHTPKVVANALCHLL